MKSKVLILDTSVLCCWLQVPGKETAGPLEDRWDHTRIKDLLVEEDSKGSTFVLPMATLIETGNHIAQAPEHRFECAMELANCLRQAADESSPWAAFTDQSKLWTPSALHSLAEAWPRLAASGMSLGDATIKDVAEYYAEAGWKVEILTGDKGLKAYEPPPRPVPRRRK